MYSAQEIDLDGIPMEEVVVLEPLAFFSVPDASLDSRPMAGNMDWNPSEYVVPKEDQTSRPTEGVTSPAPLRHSMMQLHLDSQPSRNKLKPDQSGDPVPDDTPRRQVGFYGNQTVPDFLVDVNVDGGGDPVPKPAPSELQGIRRQWNTAPGQDIRCRMTHQAEQCVFMTVRQCQTSWWTRRRTGMILSS